MVKGGFQGLDISGVDLTAQSPTLPGAYATCAGADGKPIRVQTADGQVECSVKKVSTNYVLAGVTGDGKILSITIGSTNGITVVKNTPTVSGANYRLGKAVDISAYTSSDTPYVVPSDGIIRLLNLSTTALVSAYTVEMNGISSGGVDTYFTVLTNIAGSTNPCAEACSVRKGQKVYMQKNTAAAEEAGNPKMYFAPYEKV